MVGGPGGLVCEPDHTPATRFKRYRVRGSRRLGSATWVASVKCLGKSSVQSGSEEAAETGKPPISSDLTQKVPCQDRVVTDVVDLILPIGTMAQDHVGGGASRWGWIRF